MQVERLTKAYRNITVVNNLSFNLDKGKCAALLGPNGAGKTTTLHMIAGLTAPNKGKIFLKINSIKTYDHLLAFCHSILRFLIG
ncbi:ATP-binding cassette domain-containing protein [Priestia sp. OVS21]|nr:ATP-binding cassette domain-containing protein [Priestia sp. OVS21]